MQHVCCPGINLKVLLLDKILWTLVIWSAKFNLVALFILTNPCFGLTGNGPLKTRPCLLPKAETILSTTPTVNLCPLFSISSYHSLTGNPKLSSVIQTKPINDSAGQCQLSQQANGSDYKWRDGCRRYLKP